jgi:ubiquitin-protein ligase
MSPKKLSKTFLDQFSKNIEISSSHSKNASNLNPGKASSGTEYSGNFGETSLERMQELHLKYIDKDQTYYGTLNSMLNAKQNSASEELLNAFAYLIRETSFAEMAENRPALFEKILKLITKWVSSEIKDLIINHKVLFRELSVKSKESEFYETNDRNQKKFQDSLKNLITRISPEMKTCESTPINPELDERKVQFIPDLNSSYFHSEADFNAKPLSTKMNRLRKDLSILASSLPPGIFVKISENRMDIMKVMIIGPQETPYENGCFIFELYIPSGYPTSSPKMKFLTTGGGKFRFNPNLYACGNICLSLLGTWSGPNWNGNTCSILQLLVSIQSMVFNKYPLWNEPGYYSSLVNDNALAYNNGIMRGTLCYAMTNYLKSPDVHFKEEIKLHFSSCRENILKQLNNWEILCDQYPKNCTYFNWTGIFSNHSFTLMKQEFESSLSKLTL